MDKLRLLMHGFITFKTLQKSECCLCIQEHYLPHRSYEDIRKQLNFLINNESCQKKLKELLKKQKKQNASLLSSFEFNRDIHYKSPFEQSLCGRVSLPSMYTVRILPTLP